MKRRSGGFTLVELLVALFALSLLAIMSWRGIDGMTRVREQTETRADEVLTLQVALSQWGADLDALYELPQFTALSWNGRVLRMTRRGTAAQPDGMLVVAWTRRTVEGSGTWLRWQSPPLTTRGEVDAAWRKADTWSQTPDDEARRREVAVAPLDDWQIFYYRSDAWTNPLSSDATGFSAGGATGAGPGVGVVPDGVRLVLTLPAGHAMAGVLSRDWVRPTLGGGKE